MIIDIKSYMVSKKNIIQDEFKPDLKPLEMFQRGVFGGSYWRPIYSSVTKKYYVDDYKEFAWTQDLNTDLLNKPDYDPSINAYGVNCGLGLQDWETKNWIHAQDPRGWVQWYCRYHGGRRTQDDYRQIKRWKRIVRFKNMLKKNPSSRKIKQVLLHWAIDPLLLENESTV